MLAIQASYRLLFLTAVDYSVEVIVEKVVNVFKKVGTVSLNRTWNKQTLRKTLFDAIIFRVTRNLKLFLAWIFPTMAAYHWWLWRWKSLRDCYLLCLLRFPSQNLISTRSILFIFSLAFLALLLKWVEVLSDQRIVIIFRVTRHKRFNRLNSSSDV